MASRHLGRVLAIALPSLAVGLIAFLLLTSPFIAEGQKKPVQLGVRPQAVVALSAAQLSDEFNRTMAEKNVSPADRQKNLAGFQKFPLDLQLSILRRISPRLAPNKSYLVSGAYLNAASIIARLNLFDITFVFPTDAGQAGDWSFACGDNFNSNCSALIDGKPVQSIWSGSNVLLPNTLCFKIPTSITLGVNHSLAVTNSSTHATTAAVQYKIIAQQGYRAWYGWSFPNFGDPTIPWTAYADYFGTANVQYADGSHRAAAQSYYDNTYKGCGGGGNCFGMSVSSLRYNNGLGMGYWNGWFHTSPNPLGSIWDYSFVTQPHQTVQEYQGSWFSEEVLDTHATTSKQDAHACFNRVVSLLGYGLQNPVLVMWGHGSGHAIVPYGTNVSGDDHQMICYDNNYPYSETETNGPDPTISHVAWGANTFSDPTESWAQVAECMSYAEVTPANPHLPGAKYGGPGSTATVVSSGSGTQISQITDEAGHTFFNADGSVNRGPSAIPNSAIVYPLVQVLKGASALLAGRPANQPILFVFSQSGGKALTFQIGGGAGKSLQLYFPGFAFSLQATGGGTLRAYNLLRSNLTLEISNPSALRPTALDIIHSEAAGDRAFQLRNMSGLTGNPLLLLPAVDGSKLNIQAAPNLKFDLNLRGPLGQGEGKALFSGIVTKSAGAQLASDNWSQLGTSGLLVQHLNAAGGVQTEVHLAPAH